MYRCVRRNEVRLPLVCFLFYYLPTWYDLPNALVETSPKLALNPHITRSRHSIIIRVVTNSPSHSSGLLTCSWYLLASCTSHESIQLPTLDYPSIDLCSNVLTGAD
ncbi:hypothetical protein BDV40DRAFT_215527 [Aspergillus tamarii]|uniref:Uncharacterized protein n=1 Tax=Aspergillus tamarii TaxID=41984 RepID=A0A5N6UPG4_ASPTM|nr:hypothetical protein BDV40DRAFT_215527 [Aspergillus tamarii]